MAAALVQATIREADNLHTRSRKPRHSMGFNQSIGFTIHRRDVIRQTRAEGTHLILKSHRKSLADGRSRKVGTSGRHIQGSRPVPMDSRSIPRSVGPPLEVSTQRSQQAFLPVTPTDYNTTNATLHAPPPVLVQPHLLYAGYYWPDPFWYGPYFGFGPRVYFGGPRLMVGRRWR